MKYVRKTPNGNFMSNVTIYPGKNGDNPHGTNISVGTYKAKEKAYAISLKAMEIVKNNSLTYEEKRMFIENLRIKEMQREKRRCCGHRAKNDWLFCPICGEKYA